VGFPSCYPPCPLTASQFVTALLLTSLGAGTALPPLRYRHILSGWCCASNLCSLERRWSALSCHTDNYQHTASWGYTTGMEGQIALACGVMIGHLRPSRWIAGDGTLLVSVPLPAGGHATHIQVSFVARGAGVLLSKTMCAGMLKVVLNNCATVAAAGKKAGKLHGGLGTIPMRARLTGW
jgi:hypothetical protein